MPVSHPAALRALVDRLIPADEYPSGWDSGVGDFLERIFAADLAGAADRLSRGLADLDAAAAAIRPGAAFADLDAAEQDRLLAEAEQFTSWITPIVMQGYYGDPGNGGNRDRVSWRAVGYREVPQGVPEPEPPLLEYATARPDSAAAHYDAIVVGAGAGGGIAACLLAEAGQRVLLVERGGLLPSARPDHVRNQRSVFGYETPAGPPIAGNPRVVADGSTVSPADGRWSNNAMVLGGGTRVYGAQAWRFCPEDFRMAGAYGVPEGSSLSDWPILYADLEPYYDRAEWELGVSGDPSGNSAEGPRRRGYPMPPMPQNPSGAALAAGAARLGWTVGPVPLLINSRDYGGRPACIACGTCVGFGCLSNSKNGTHNTVIPRALATGNCDLLLEARAERLLTDAAGAVTGVALAGERDGRIWRREIGADQIVVAAGAIETARLLLNSRSDREPNGIGNDTDQVGRNLQGHVYTGAVGMFDDVVQTAVGPGPTISTNDFRHGNDGILGGGMLANDFVPSPINSYGLLSRLGLVPRWGAQSKAAMRQSYSRATQVMGPMQESPNPESRVTVADNVTDSLGIPVARLSGRVLPCDRPTARFMSDRAVEWLRASGAERIAPMAGIGNGPSGGQHQAGTCRMGTDPRSSVVDERCRVWGHPNLRLADGSVHVTNGGVNPVLTIMANAYRTIDLMLQER